MNNIQIIRRLLDFSDLEQRPQILNAALEADIISKQQFIYLCHKFELVTEEHYAPV